MPQRDSKVAQFSITDTGGTARLMQAHLTLVDGLPGPRDLNDITRLGDSGHTFAPGLENATITLEGIYDDSTTLATSPRRVFHGLRTATTASAFIYSPSGTGTDLQEHSGNCFVQDYVEPARVGSMVTFRASLRVNGTVTSST